MKNTYTISNDQLLPILILRNTVVFPEVAMPVLVTKASGLNAIHYAIDKDKERKFIALTIKENTDLDNIRPTDFYRVGTLCVVERIEKNEKGDSIAYIKSVERFDAKNIQFDFLVNAWFASGELSPDINDVDTATAKALLHSLKDVADEILHSIKAPDNFQKIIDGISDLAQFTNVVCQHLPIIISKKQEMLELVSVKNRALKVLELLVEQREMIKVSNEMGVKISEKTSKAYRESILREQLKVIKEELGEGDTSGEKKSLKDRILEAKLPKDVEKVALEQCSRYENMGAQNAESHVIRNYIELILDLPWNKEANTIIDIEAAQKILDEEHYGLEKVKRRIIQHLAVMKLSPHKKGNILLLVGPPGVGKTSLGQSIAKALGRKFVKTSLGGLRDDAEIRGHRRTYVGALPGRIIENLKRAKEKNPVFMLDEIDKLSRSTGGDPASALLEVLDPEQNKIFTDQYLDLPFDLSKVFFIATANSLDTIPLPLLDRMEVIHLSGYTQDEKLHIAKNHLLPKNIKEFGLKPEQVEISDTRLGQIISDYTRESGVRSLQRKINAVLSLVAEKVVKDPTLEKVVVDTELLEDALGVDRISFELAQEKSIPGVVTGLAWTPVGGDILFIETAMMPGSGRIQLTGKLGEVMSESAHIGLSLVRSKLTRLLKDFDFSKTDFHIHVPSGAIPKDGPSAGITIFTALCSLVLGKEVDPKLAMTGEVTLRGAVMPVGGIKEKLIAAHRAGIKKVILSKRNEKDLKEVPKVVKEEMEFVFVENISELLVSVFGNYSKGNYFELDLPFTADQVIKPHYLEDFGMKNEPGL